LQLRHGRQSPKLLLDHLFKRLDALLREVEISVQVTHQPDELAGETFHIGRRIGASHSSGLPARGQ
jgi:hypothetical protein